MSRFVAQRYSILFACWLVAGLIGSGATAAEDRATFDAAYRAELTALAAKCDELKLPKEAKLTREWFVVRLPDRQYFFVPPDHDTTAPPATAPLVVRQWHGKFLALRQAQAKRLLELAQDQLDKDDYAAVYALLHETLREDPDQATARAILGFQAVNGKWRIPGPSNAAVKATQRHPLLKFPAGGYWRVTTPHFQIVTSAGSEPGLRFGEKLEALHTVWRQAFFDYWSTAAQLQEQFDKPAPAKRLREPYDVVLFRHRAEYQENLAALEPRLAVTKGYYLQPKKLSFFYQEDERSLATAFHEVTHQLFAESMPTKAEIGAKGNFWIVEGAALYFESLRLFEGYATLGGWDAERMQFARHHVYNSDYQMPLEALCALTRDSLQQDENIRRIYSQAAGQAHYLCDAHGGKYRAAAQKYIAAVYAGDDKPDTLAKLTATPLAAHDAAYREFLRVSDADVATLPAPHLVRSLALGGQPISDAAFEKISTCTSLTWLDLAGTKVTDAGVAKLSPLKALTQLNLEQTAISDATLKVVAQLPELVELDLSRTAVTDAGAAELAKLRGLRVLWLTGTRVTDASVPTLSKLKLLETLELDETQISAAGREQLRRALPKWEP